MPRTGQVLLLVLMLISVLAGVPEDSSAAAAPMIPEPQTSSSVDLEAEFAAQEIEIFDPLSGYNRAMTQVNDRLYFWLFKPVARGYSKVVPEVARLGIGRFFTNLAMPVRLANNLLQLKFKGAATELARFTLNSTVGFFGFADPARSGFGLEPYPEDFGQTLGHYGLGGGVHLVLPLLGPSNLRDILGRFPDYYLTPVNYVDPWEVQWSARGTEQVNNTSLRLGEYESLKKDAIDLYPFLRDAYEQRREEAIEE